MDILFVTSNAFSYNFEFRAFKFGYLPNQLLTLNFYKFKLLMISHTLYTMDNHASIFVGP